MSEETSISVQEFAQADEAITQAHRLSNRVDALKPRKAESNARENFDEQEQSEAINSGRKRSPQEAALQMLELEREEQETINETTQQEIDLINADIPEESLKLMGEFRYSNFMRGLMRFLHLEKEIDFSRAKLSFIRELAKKEKDKLNSVEMSVANKIQREIWTAKEDKKNLEQANPETFYGINMLKIRRYAEQLREGRLVETEYVEEQSESIIDDLSKNNVRFLYGETGAGKTEIAKLAAKRFSGSFDKSSIVQAKIDDRYRAWLNDHLEASENEKLLERSKIEERALDEASEALVVRGYSGMGSEEMFGHLGLSASQINRASEIPRRIESEFALWKEQNPDTKEEQEQSAKAQITRKITNESSVTISEYILGSVYNAAKEGRVVIIDEANYIPPDLLAKLNDIMTKVPGEKINIQEDGAEPIAVKEGFGIILTGNINVSAAKRYKNRLELDPALVDRVTLSEYNYLPQEIDGDKSRVDQDKKQLFEVVIASLVDKKGGLNIPKNSEDQLWKFAQYAALTQLIFAGKIEGTSNFAFNSGGTKVGVQTDLAISPRGMNKILSDWQGDGYKLELDHYIHKHLINRATNLAQRAYLYQLAQRYGFFASDGWEQNPDYGRNGLIQKFDVVDPQNQSESLEYLTPPQVVEAVYGNPPERKDWPNKADVKQSQDRETAQELVNYELRFAELTKQVEDWREKIGDVCPIPGSSEEQALTQVEAGEPTIENGEIKEEDIGREW